jgi:hypothetical protein
LSSREDFMFSLCEFQETLHCLYSPLGIVAAFAETREEDVDIWHTLWFIRPLMVLVIACPFLIIPALLSLLRKYPRQRTVRKLKVI